MDSSVVKIIGSKYDKIIKNKNNEIQLIYHDVDCRAIVGKTMRIIEIADLIKNVPNAEPCKNCMEMTAFDDWKTYEKKRNQASEEDYILAYNAYEEILKEKSK